MGAVKLAANAKAKIADLPNIDHSPMGVSNEPAGLPFLVWMHPYVRNVMAQILPPRGGGSIFCQDVDFTERLLKLLDTLDAIRAFFSVTLGRHDRPALIAWYDCNRDRWRTVIKRR